MELEFKKILDHQEHCFDIDPGITYINCAYMGPMLKSAYEAGLQGMQMKLSPNRIRKSDFFDPLTIVQKLFAKLIDAENHERIVFIPSVSYGIAKCSC